MMAVQMLNTELRQKILLRPGALASPRWLVSSPHGTPFSVALRLSSPLVIYQLRLTDMLLNLVAHLPLVSSQRESWEKRHLLDQDPFPSTKCPCQSA